MIYRSEKERRDMTKTIWFAIEHRKIVAMWNNDYTQSLKSWRIAIKSAYPKAHIFYDTIKIV